MESLYVTEIKAFIPSRDYALSKRYYQDLGYTLASEGGGVAYFRHGQASFLLQDGGADGGTGHLHMHLLVSDVDAWWRHVRDSGVVAKYGVTCTAIETQAWRMRDFCLTDPAGVHWHIAQNID